MRSMALLQAEFRFTLLCCVDAFIARSKGVANTHAACQASSIIAVVVVSGQEGKTQVVNELT